MKDADKTVYQLERQIAGLTARREVLFKQKEPIDAELQRNYTRRETLTQLLDEKRLAATDGTDWEFLLSRDSSTSRARTDALKAALAVYNLEAAGGYFPDTQQAALQFSVPWDADDAYIAKMVEGVSVILPHLKSTADEDFDLEDTVPFDVMEYTLSEYRSYNARYDRKNDKWLLVSMRYHSPETHGSYDTLEELLRTLRTSHPYPEDPRVSYSRDDDWEF